MYEEQFTKQMLTGVDQENILFAKASELHELVINLLANKLPLNAPDIRFLHFLITGRS